MLKSYIDIRTAEDMIKFFKWRNEDGGTDIAVFDRDEKKGSCIWSEFPAVFEFKPGEPRATSVVTGASVKELSAEDCYDNCFSWLDGSVSLDEFLEENKDD